MSHQRDRDVEVGAAKIGETRAASVDGNWGVHAILKKGIFAGTETV